jgi:transcriptional regulator with XRE-family HTH domain
MEIKEILRKLIESGMTQEEIATAIGSSQTNVSRWLNDRDPKYASGKKIEQLGLSRGIFTVIK